MHHRNFQVEHLTLKVLPEAGQGMALSPYFDVTSLRQEAESLADLCLDHLAVFEIGFWLVILSTLVSAYRSLGGSG